MTAPQLRGSHLYYSLCQIEEIQPKTNACERKMLWDEESEGKSKALGSFGEAKTVWKLSLTTVT